jgi:perosamine synthetase
MIPVFEPIIGEEEINYAVDALRKGELSGTFGNYLERFENSFAAYCGCQYGVAVSNGTTALHVAVSAAGIGSGDEVLLSSCTNIATALAVVHNHARPVPIDSEAETWNLDIDLIEAKITPLTKAIIPVHHLGHPVDMDRLMTIARKHNLIVIEDAAEAHGATVRKKRVGGFGDMACFSFYANKVITTGEGGMVTTNDKNLAERMKLLRNLGFTTPRFRHEVLAHNFRMTGYQAAIGCAQLEKIEKIILEKRRVAETYNRYLTGVEGIQLPTEKEWAFNVYWMYGIVIGKGFGRTRNELINALRELGIDTRTFFCPMNQQPCLQPFLKEDERVAPVSDSLWENGMYLPSSYNLTAETIKHITDTIIEIGRNGS